MVALVVSVLCVPQVEATTYYVRTNGSNTNSGTSNTAGGAWQTITKGCGTAVAGDIVRVQSGTYVEAVSGCTSGTSGNTVTVVADGMVTTCSLSFASKNYIRFIGLTVAPATSGCSAADGISATGTNTGLEFWNVTVDMGGLANNGFALYNGSLAQDVFSTIILGGSVKNVSTSSGSKQAIIIHGNNNYVGYVAINNVGYIGIGPSGTDNRFVNIDVSALLELGADHPDGWFTQSNSGFNLPFVRNLFESWFDVGTGATAPNNKWEHMDNTSAAAWSDTVIRQHVTTNLGSGEYDLYSDNSANTSAHFYNNTHVNNAQSSPTCTTCVGNFQKLASAALSAFLYNDLLYNGWGSSATTGIDFSIAGSGASVTHDYNLAYASIGTVTFGSNLGGETHGVRNQNPLLTNVAGSDFTLSSTSSPAYHAGTALTTATSCSGTTLNVATGTGSFFIADNSANLAAYGGALVPGDTITVGTSTTRKVVSITGDAITVDSSLTCAASDPVYFGSSNTVDIGAYPYKSGGYTISATYSIAGGTATITPNDASLVRFVVCYDSSVPIAVVNASPYTCTVGSGTFSAVVYPRYASLSQGTTAITTAELNQRLRSIRVGEDLLVAPGSNRP